MTTIVWDPAGLQRLKQAYAEAVEKGQGVFLFEGHEFVAGYAKYFIEHLEDRWNLGGRKKKTDER